jgi:thymidine kinase
MQNQIKPPRFGNPEYAQMMKDAKNSQPTEQLSLQTESKPKNERAQRIADRLKSRNAEPQKILIPCDKLIIDENQPFRLYNNEQLADLAERIKQKLIFCLLQDFTKPYPQISRRT